MMRTYVRNAALNAALVASLVFTAVPAMAETTVKERILPEAYMQQPVDGEGKVISIPPGERLEKRRTPIAAQYISVPGAVSRIETEQKKMHSPIGPGGRTEKYVVGARPPREIDPEEAKTSVEKRYGIRHMLQPIPERPSKRVSPTS